MIEDLIQLLESEYGYPVYLQGSMSSDETYPDNFFTYWINESNDESHYDNDGNAIVWDYDLNFYSNNPLKVHSMMLNIKKLLKQNDFIVSGGGYSVMSDETTHTGRGLNVLYRQNFLD
jgi:hypothetical protein